MKKAIRYISYSLLTVLMIPVVLTVLAYVTTFHPDNISEEKVNCTEDAPLLDKTNIKVLSWNIQYLAGKSYVFFYDTAKGDGPDTRPSMEEIKKTAIEIARVINSENPDIILFQEVDDGSTRTENEDQLQRLLPLLDASYKCNSSAFYWKNAFNPHPKINGSIGMKLSTVSKYKISKSFRHQLPMIPNNFFVKNFILKRAILEVKIPTANKVDLSIMNTHLDAFAQGENTMDEQVKYVEKLLSKYETDKVPYLIGGDFNLLPPGIDIKELGEDSIFYNPKSEVEPLFKSFKSAFTLAQLTSKDRNNYFTQIPNKFEKDKEKPDRTIDYIFYGNINLIKSSVRSNDTTKISDHLPVIVDFEISK